ncbi:MAG: hypothetical protein J5819_01360 [Eubacterium sp.]|nr:hypothetical protein [Eubacterium sp.]
MKGKKMFKRILAGFITTALCLSLICTNGIISHARGKKEFDMFAQGQGTEQDPYVIDTVTRLVKFRDSVNSGTNYKDKYIRLGADIDLSSVCYPHAVGNSIESVNWVPIGSVADGDHLFYGTFDGGGHTISNLYIKDGGDWIGLFDRNKGDIKNLTVTGDVSGGTRVGGITSENNATIDNCSFYGHVTGTGERVGGIAGQSRGSFLNCYHDDKYKDYYTVVQGERYVGGVVGYLFESTATIDGCYFLNGSVTGRFSGGIVGQANGDVSNCWAQGEIQSPEWYAGGIVGVSYKNNVSKCYFLGGTVTTAGRGAGGIVGLSNALSVKDCSTGKIRVVAESVDDSCTAGGIVGGNASPVENCNIGSGTEVVCWSKYAHVLYAGGIAGETFPCHGIDGKTINCVNRATVYCMGSRCDYFIGDPMGPEDIQNCVNEGGVLHPLASYEDAFHISPVELRIVGDIINSCKLTICHEGEGSAEGGSTSMETTSFEDSGKVIQLHATAAEGYVFDSWKAEGVTLENPNDAETTFTMPDNEVNIKAIFKLDTQHYELTVNREGAGHVSSNSSNCIVSGSAVKLTATPDSGYKFSKWESNDIEIADVTSATVSFTMPANPVTIKAVFEPAKSYDFKIAHEYIGAPNYNVEYSYPRVSGQTVFLSEKIPDYEYVFSRWEVEGITLDNSNDSMISFSMPENPVSVKAIYVPAENIYDLDINLTGPRDMYVITPRGFNPIYTPCSYKTRLKFGSYVKLTAPQLFGTGYQFTGWETEGVYLDNPQSQYVEFTMPANSVSIAPCIYPEKDVHNVTVESDGGGDDPAATANFSRAGKGQKVPLYADADSGYEFKNWTVNSNSITLNNPTSATEASFTMGDSDVTVTAHFNKVNNEPADDEKEPGEVSEPGEGSNTGEGSEANGSGSRPNTGGSSGSYSSGYTDSGSKTPSSDSAASGAPTDPSTPTAGKDPATGTNPAVTPGTSDPVITKNPDGSTTTTTTTIGTDGSSTVKNETVKTGDDGTTEKTVKTETTKTGTDGTVEKVTETVSETTKTDTEGKTEKTETTEKTVETTKSTEDGKTETTTETNRETVTTDADGKKETTTETKKETITTDKDGNVEKSTETVKETVKSDGSKEKTSDIEKADGTTIHEEVKTNTAGRETSRMVETAPGGDKTMTEQVTQPSGDYSKVAVETKYERDEDGNITGVSVTLQTEQKTGETIQKTSFVVLDAGKSIGKYTANSSMYNPLERLCSEAAVADALAGLQDRGVAALISKQTPAGNNSVALTSATTTAKNGRITIPKTVKADGVTYTVTTLKKGILKENNKKPSVLMVKANGITKVEAGAFSGIKKNAVIKIKASKPDYKRIKILIRKSGLPKSVKIKRA